MKNAENYIGSGNRFMFVQFIDDLNKDIVKINGYMKEINKKTDNSNGDYHKALDMFVEN